MKLIDFQMSFFQLMFHFVYVRIVTVFNFISISSLISRNKNTEMQICHPQEWTTMIINQKDSKKNGRYKNIHY